MRGERDLAKGPVLKLSYVNWLLVSTSHLQVCQFVLLAKSWENVYPGQKKGGLCV